MHLTHHRSAVLLPLALLASCAAHERRQMALEQEPGDTAEEQAAQPTTAAPKDAEKKADSAPGPMAQRNRPLEVMLDDRAEADAIVGGAVGYGLAGSVALSGEGVGGGGVGRGAATGDELVKEESLALRADGSVQYRIAQDAPPPPAEPPPSVGTERYQSITENGFEPATQSPLSTFSVDVDTASYSNVRRFLEEGSLPPVDAVRIEELINYFPYEYPEPEAGQPFTVITEVASCPWAEGHRLVHIGLQGDRMSRAELPARNLTFLIDVSGSMDSPDRLPLVRAGLRKLTEQLRAEDHVSIVVYAGAAGLVLPPTSGAHKAPILAALDRLSAGGSTAGGEGIQLAYDVAKRHFRPNAINRVVLATDGDFNVGMTGDGDLVRLVEKERESGVFLTVLGFGRGNLQDARMEQLADKGNGNYAYIDDINEAHKAFGEEAGASLVTIAKDVKIQVEWNPSEVAAYRLVGYENRRLAAQDFNDDRKDAGEIGAGHHVTALYEVVPAGQPVPGAGVDPLTYQRPAAVGAAPGELLTVKLRWKAPHGSTSELASFPLVDRRQMFTSASRDFRFSAAVAGFGMILRQSAHKGGLDFRTVREMGAAALGSDVGGYRREFLGLVETAAALSGSTLEKLSDAGGVGRHSR